MSHKNAIKMINIQKSYLVHLGPIQSTLFHNVHFGSIQSTLVLFSPLCPLRLYLVDMGPIRSIMSTLS